MRFITSLAVGCAALVALPAFAIPANYNIVERDHSNMVSRDDLELELLARGLPSQYREQNLGEAAPYHPVTKYHTGGYQRVQPQRLHQVPRAGELQLGEGARLVDHQPARPVQIVHPTTQHPQPQSAQVVRPGAPLQRRPAIRYPSGRPRPASQAVQNPQQQPAHAGSSSRLGQSVANAKNSFKNTMAKAKAGFSKGKGKVGKRDEMEVALVSRGIEDLFARDPELYARLDSRDEFQWWK